MDFHHERERERERERNRQKKKWTEKLIKTEREKKERKNKINNKNLPLCDTCAPANPHITFWGTEPQTAGLLYLSRSYLYSTIYFYV